MPTIDFQVLNNNNFAPTLETLSGSGIGFLALVPDLQFKLVNTIQRNLSATIYYRDHHQY